MGLFDKKYCDICGEKIKLLGNRKLEDGNLCKDCSLKLSPWFSERRSSTVADIQAQLEYREDNKRRVAEFNTTRTIGEYYMVILDEDHGKFCVAQARDVRTGNPDILDFTQVTGCDLEIDEDRREVYDKDPEGKNISFNPPRYDYDYDFYIHLRVNHPWFDEMKFKINRSSVRIEYGSTMPTNPNRGFAGQAADQASRPAAQAGTRPTPGAQSGTRPTPGAARPTPGAARPTPGAARPTPGAQPNRVTSTIRNTFNAMASAPSATVYNPASYPEYQRYVDMGNEIREAIMQVRQDARDSIAAANAPKMAVTCPFCGASTIPDINGCCEFCGGAVNG